jgi:hypothetical protein
MTLQDFAVGEFWTDTGEWRCTNIGSRVVVAIKLDRPYDPSWCNGPPYAVAEHVFDESDMSGCSKTAITRCA